MKLPQAIEGIHREGRTDSFTSAGVEPLFVKSWAKKAWKGAKKVGKKVGKVAWRHKCLGCFAIPNPAASMACQLGCGLISKI